MSKKQTLRKITVPPEVLRKLTSPPGKYDTLWRHLSDDGTMVDIYKIEFSEELKRQIFEVGLKQLRAAEKGGKQPKVRIGIALAIAWGLHHYPNMSSRELWIRLMRFGELEPLRIKEDGARYDIYGTDDERIAEVRIGEDGETDDRVKYLRFRAFQTYFSRLKKVCK